MLEPVVDDILSDEQPGFREEHGCSDKIFIVRHLMQQANEMKLPLRFCFVDFEKALNSILRRTMGKIKWHCGIPQEFLRVFLNMFGGTYC